MATSDASPCTAVELASKKRAGVRRSHLYLEGPELLALADAMPAHWLLPVLVAGSCGLRAGELWALRRRDVDLLHKELTVRYALKEINSSATSLAESKGLLVGPPKSAASRRRVSIPAGLVPRCWKRTYPTPPASPGGYAIARAVDEDRADLDHTSDATDPDRLLFVTARGYPVRHNLFYKRVPADDRGQARRPRQARTARPGDDARSPGGCSGAAGKAPGAPLA